MTVDVYTVVPKLFIQPNLVYHRPKMTAMPSVPYGFLSPLHNIYTTATAYYTDWATLPAPLKIVPTSASNINVLVPEIKITQIQSYTLMNPDHLTFCDACPSRLLSPIAVVFPLIVRFPTALYTYN
jgi:hypothetical protein